MNGLLYVCHVSKYFEKNDVEYLKLYMDTYKMKGIAMGAELKGNLLKDMTFVEVSEKLQLRYRHEVLNQVVRNQS